MSNIWLWIVDAGSKKELKSKQSHREARGMTAAEWLKAQEEAGNIVECPLYNAKFTRDKCLGLQAEMHAMKDKKKFRQSNIMLGFYREHKDICPKCKNAVPAKELKGLKLPHRVTSWREFQKKRKGLMERNEENSDS